MKLQMLPIYGTSICEIIKQIQYSLFQVAMNPKLSAKQHPSHKLT